MFTVLWKKSAVRDLGSLWMEADAAFRKAITAASDQIDKTLKRDPESIGESRDESKRFWFVFPLCILFKVDASTKIVRVLQVWKYNKRAK